MAHIQVGDIRYYYELHGRGKPLVFISGYGANHTAWREIYPRFTDRFRVMIFDNPASGRTRDGGGELSAEAMAAGSAGLIRELGLGRADIVGHSMGGTIAQVLAADYPEVVDRLVIVNSAARWSRRMLMAQRGLLRALKRGISLDCQLELAMPWLFGRAALNDRKRAEALRRKLLDNPNPPTIGEMERQYPVLAGFDAAAFLPRISAPTLVVISDDDILALPGESEELAAGIAGAKVVRLNGGHVSGYEEPEKLAAAIRRFLAGPEG
ncbi:MAG: alpha/beta hydrolase [Candidatus Erginobacter occultus]|nr:alpha/beta hydrolase [Candidatus Erginobacter occultus]